MSSWFDIGLMEKLPRWSIYFWGMFVAVVFLCTLQESTHVFYGPTRVLYADGATITGTVSTRWAENVGLLLIPLTWIFMWCALRLRVAILMAVAGAILFITWGFVSFEMLNQWSLGSYRWEFTGDPGQGIAGYFSNRIVLQAIHDPLDTIETALGLFGWLAILMLFFSGNFHALYRARKIGDVCASCDYDLRGTPSRICPECGCRNDRNNL